ncbi:hypothetical protein D3C76_815990 [compost metagenome]
MITEGRPSSRNSHCHPCKPHTPSSPSISPEIADPKPAVNGIAIMNRALARARYAAGNQNVRYSSTPGRKPASVIPTRIRSRYRLLASVAKSVAVEASPQAIIRLPIHLRAPTLAKAMLLGIPQAI